MTINIKHKVTLVPQTTASNCWLAAVAMLKGATTYTPGPIDSSFFRSDYGGIPSQAEYYKRLARAYRLRYAELRPSTGARSTLLQLQRPLKIAPVGVFDTQRVYGKVTPHATVIGAMQGDGTPAGTTLTEYDPWPVNWGKIRRISYQAWITRSRYLSSLTTILCLLY